MIGARDLDYIETRLLAPATNASDAIERLRHIGQTELADEVMTGLQAFTDVCRKARTDLVAVGRAERGVRP
jgi:hypothetical protein